MSPFFGTADPLPNLPVIGALLDGIERALAEPGRNGRCANVPEGDRIPPFLGCHAIEGVVIVEPGHGVLPSEYECGFLARL